MRALIYFIFGILLFSTCSSPDIRQELDDSLTDLRYHIAPDQTVAWFHWELSQSNGGWEISGETTIPVVFDSIQNLLDLKGWEKRVFNKMVMLPLPDEPYPGATARRSVVNLRAEPRHSSELVSQALMGTPMKILKTKGYWLLVQTPDKYISWVDKSSVSLMDLNEMKDYFTGPRVMVTVPHSHLMDLEDQEILEDLVLGNTLKLVSQEPFHYKVELPYGKESVISKTEARITQNGSDPTILTELMVRQAKLFTGRPYLWGGTSIKALDCSGYTKNVYFLNGINLPRDANQQMQVGVLVDSLKDFSVVQPGDLVFFGRHATDSTAEYASHVGLYIGSGAFIHSSGNVHTSSFREDSKYFDEYNLNRYLKAKRIMGTSFQSTLSVTRTYTDFLDDILEKK